MTEPVTSYARGIMGETAARKHLEALGMVCIAQRFRAGRGEVDLICTDGPDTLAFVEVKARERCSTESSLYAVTPAKQRRIAEAAAGYLAAHPEYADHNLRFDVVTVTRGGAEHFPNAFEPEFR